KVLPDRSNPATYADVSSAGGFGRALERSVNPVGDEVERRAAVHRDRRPRMVGQHEDGGVIGGIGAPPALPRLVRPGAPDRTEHVAAQNPRADVVEPARREVVIDASRPAVLTEQLPERTGGKGPLVQCDPADAKRIVDALVGAGAVTVDR